MSDWETMPATDKQLAYLQLFGYTPEGSLSKKQANDMIDAFSEDPERCRIRNENQERQAAEYNKRRRANLAHYLHLDCEAAAKESKSELRHAKKVRLDFWKDTFDLGERLNEAHQTYIFNEQYGCRFKMPSAQQIQAILDALDKHSETWDLEYPHAFYSTAETNFPELVR